MDIIEKKSDFSREEKILLFDDLRKCYTDLVKSLKDNYSKSSPKFDKRKDSSKKFKNDDIDLLLRDSDDEEESVTHDVTPENKEYHGQWEVDASFPSGWLCKNTPFGKRYKNPQGRGFTSKYEAIRHTRENDLATSAEIKKMIDSLNGYAGWETNDSLPKFWFVRRPEYQTHYEYLTDTQVILPNMEKVVEHMKENKYSEAEIDRFKEGNGLNWKTHPDLPDGFRYGEYGGKTGNFATDRKIKTFMDPSGKRYPGIAHLVRFFI